MCSTAVKCVLFKTYCLCFYNIALWRNYTVICLNTFKASYHKCVKKFFGFARTDSMTDIIVSLKLPSFCTVLYNARVRFYAQSSLSMMMSIPSPWVHHCVYANPTTFLGRHFDIWSNKAGLNCPFIRSSLWPVCAAGNRGSEKCNGGMHRQSIRFRRQKGGCLF